MPQFNTRFANEPAEDDIIDAEDYYDANGNVSNRGMFDAGGHIVTERWIDYVDCMFSED